jgi:hypothetical protein
MLIRHIHLHFHVLPRGACPPVTNERSLILDSNMQTKNRTLEEIAGQFGDKVIVPSARQAATEIADHGTVDALESHKDSKTELRIEGV